jgi:phospholipase C
VKTIHQVVRVAVTAAGLTMASAAIAQTAPATPIQHVIVLFQENVSFDHYFATYPVAKNLPGEQAFFAYPGTPAVNGLTPDLLNANPNVNTSGTKVNPPRLSPAQAYTCSQNHNYGPEQQALNSGLMDQFPKFVGRTTSEGCAKDGSTVLGYYDGNTVAAFWNYAQNFAINDNSFGSTFGPSTPGAINLISGQTYGGVTHFGTGTTSTYPNTVTAGTGNVVTDIGDLDAYLDDCGNDKGGAVTTSTTMEMSGKNIGDLLNTANVTWGWFQGGFRPTTAATSTSPAVCAATRTAHEYPSVSPTVVVPNPDGSPLQTGADIHTPVADYSSHHQPFMYYASTRNPHHLPPTSVAAIGSTDQANHQYDTLDFFAALAAGNLPAVSFIKAPEAYDGHPGYSDPTAEQYWLTQFINTVMQSPFWSSTAIVIAYDDSDGWYDHVTGPIVSPSNVTISGQANAYDNLAGVGNCGNPAPGAQQARCGYGPRLPLVVVSPWANPNYVDHTLTNQTSIINFIESNWNLPFIDGAAVPPAGTASFDRYSGPLTNMFNFNAPPSVSPVLLTCSGAYASTPAAACQLDPTP